MEEERVPRSRRNENILTFNTVESIEREKVVWSECSHHPLALDIYCLSQPEGKH